jgi:outer membrane protein OmpA-like peptidoglycan-associated protein
MNSARRAAVLIMLLGLPTLAFAQQSSPRSTLDTFLARATAIVRAEPDPALMWPELQRLAGGLFDGEHAARRTLGAGWEERSAAERVELSGILAGVLAHAYLELAKARLPRDRPLAMRVISEDVTPAGATVRTMLRARDGNDVRLDYLMIRPQSDWRVYDVIVDGVSMVENYRAQFARMARTSSPADAMSALRRLAPVATAEAAPSPTATATVVAYFPTAGAQLGAGARGDLDRLVASLDGHERTRVAVESHADARGDARANHALAERRADAVRRYLVSRGLTAERIAAVVHGDSQPVCRDQTETCWAKNRRVVVRPLAENQDLAREER